MALGIVTTCPDILSLSARTVWHPQHPKHPMDHPMALLPGHHPRLRAVAIAGGLPGMSCLTSLGMGWDAGHVGY